jgi:hypothetical protein
MDTTRGTAVGRTLLAVLLLSMSGLQVSDLGGFGAVLDTYRIGGAGAALAVLLVVLELIGGAGLLVPATRGIGSIVAVAVAALWSGLAVQAFARGLTIDNCGCFGVHLEQPLRWWVLVQDAWFLAVAVWVARRERTGRSWPSPRAARRGTLV